MPLKGLTGKRAIVTGAASGIGAAICARLKSEGVEVFAIDVTEADDVERLAAQAGTPDFLVNLPKAALTPQDSDEKAWAALLAADLTSAYLVCREFAPRMKAKQAGRIINFTSIAAPRGSDRVGVHYAAAKGGIIGLTKTLALELGPFGIAVNAIAPGDVKTGRTAKASRGVPSPEADKLFAELLPLRRAGRPEDIAGVVAMLCSDAGAYVSGATIEVNGGWHFAP